MGDVVDMIMADHREVERLFDKLARDPGTRALNVPVLSALLVAHSRAEEAEVYPVAREEAGAADEVAHSQEEHLQAEQILQRLQATDPMSDEFETVLQELVEAVTHHVEEEEFNVLPAMRSQLADPRREQLGGAFAASREQHLGQVPGAVTKEQLMQMAENVGMAGASSMSKTELETELRRQAEQAE
ncbi:MAG: hemerythrin domain-containing protein [Jiangellaceae bacterium]|nr:hemerythrin domain-containing protein [Jiangellaceae bacterium]